MILVGLLVASTLISLTKSSPLSYATYRRQGLSDGNDQIYLPYLINDREPSANEVDWPQITQELMAKVNNSKSSGERFKRIGSLSIVNSLDVLRERLQLELARRKAMQDQMQINANRRYLNSIGKRSTQKNYDMNYSKFMGMRNNQQIFNNKLIDNNQVQNHYPTRNPLERTLDWYNFDDSDDQNDDNNQSSKMETNELRLL